MKLSKDSGVSRLRGNRSISLFIVLMLIGFIGAGVNAYFVLRDASFDQRYLELAGDLRLYTQQIETSSREAAAGEAEQAGAEARPKTADRAGEHSAEHRVQGQLLDEAANVRAAFCRRARAAL